MSQNLDIVIPVQRETKLLEQCIKAIEANTTNYRLHVIKEPNLNVAEARQLALDTIQGDFICFLDDDSVVKQNWLGPLQEALARDPDAVVAFGTEMWCGKPVNNYNGIAVVDKGPAACMLIDRRRMPNIRWNKYIGLRSGWLGGDFEEVEFVDQLLPFGKHCVGVQASEFDHVDRPPMAVFATTDRAKTCWIMQFLIKCKKDLCPTNEDFFRKLKYVKADPDNDRMLAPGVTLRDAFHEVFKDHNMLHYPCVKRWGLA